MTHSLTYRTWIARFLLVWMCVIVISGVVFMHKEVTSTGEIVTHIHPYNLGEKKHHHHHSDAEIRYLDIVFQGSYLNWEPLVYSLPIPTVLSEIPYAELLEQTRQQDLVCHLGRGPPSFLA